MNLEYILGSQGPISEYLDGYEYRPQQIEAAITIAKALSSRKLCIVEAGTGVGKSIAYLLPAVEYIRSGKKLVISTHTLYLQSQLISKDIPFVKTILPDMEVKVALVKGRSNYLCLNNLNDELGQLQLIGDRNTERLRKWSQKTKTGDVSELRFSFSGWSDICSDQDTCRHQNCRQYKECFYYAMRKSAEDADIIVTNHSLFFSDLALRSIDPNAGVLPEYGAVVFDEAHHLEDVATKTFGIEISDYRIPSLLNKIRRTKGIAVDTERIAAIEEANSALFANFSQYPKQEYFLEDVYARIGREHTQTTAAYLNTMMEGLKGNLSGQKTDGQPELEDRISGLKRTTNRLIDDIGAVFTDETKDYFKWGERYSGKKVGCVLRSSPLSVAAILADTLWNQVSSVVLTSATLSNSGTFDYVKNRLGIPECIELIEDSPFDYKIQSMLYIPRHLDFPSERSSYADAVAGEIEQLLRASKGRAFVLFTSYRMMNAVYDRLADKAPYPMLKQGDLSNELLIREFKSSKDSCLFGVYSFWEGVDVRGEALSCVVIDKLPFSPPDSPVNRARMDAVLSEGGDAFTQYAIPQAQIRLKQGFGRLIRTKNDRGIVAILDSRLLKKTYGREFLRFLPPSKQTSQMEEIRDFFSIYS